MQFIIEISNSLPIFHYYLQFMLHECNNIFKFYIILHSRFFQCNSKISATFSEKKEKKECYVSFHVATLKNICLYPLHPFINKTLEACWKRWTARSETFLSGWEGKLPAAAGNVISSKASSTEDASV